MDNNLLGEWLKEDTLAKALRDSNIGGISGRVVSLNTPKGDLVVKQGHYPESYNARWEYAALKFVQRVAPGVAPIPYFFDSDRNILISEKISGQNPEVFDRGLVLNIAENLSTIHSRILRQSGVPGVERHDIYTPFERVKQQADFLAEWFLKMNQYTRDEELSSNLSSGAREILNAAVSKPRAFATPGFVLTHYDINPDNLFVQKPSKVIFIDWAQAYIADPAMDIAKFFYKCELSKVQQEIFLRNYRIHLGEGELRERIMIYDSLVRLGSFCWRMRVLNEDVKKDNMKRYLRLGRIEDKLDNDIEFIRGSIK